MHGVPIAMHGKHISGWAPTVGKDPWACHPGYLHKVLTCWDSNGLKTWWSLHVFTLSGNIWNVCGVEIDWKLWETAFLVNTSSILYWNYSHLSRLPQRASLSSQSDAHPWRSKMNFNYEKIVGPSTFKKCRYFPLSPSSLFFRPHEVSRSQTETGKTRKTTKARPQKSVKIRLFTGRNVMWTTTRATHGKPGGKPGLGVNSKGLFDKMCQSWYICCHWTAGWWLVCHWIW